MIYEIQIEPTYEYTSHLFALLRQEDKEEEAGLQ